MPTYEYACANCHRHTEAVQRFDDPPLTVCPHCGGPLKRVFHPVGIVLKGSGFYSTDNRSRSKAGATPKETKPEAPGDTSSATTAETKTETKKSDPGPSKSKSKK